MTIRASYGLFRDYPDLYKYQSIREAPPWSSNITVSSPDFADPWRGYPGGSPYPVVLTPDIQFPTAAGYLNRPEHVPSMYVHQWNLSLQRQLGTDWLVSANYIGSSTIHLFDIVQTNPAIFIPGVGDASGSCFLNGQRVHFTVNRGTDCSTVANTEQRRKLTLQNPEQGKYYGSLGNLDAGGTMSFNGLLLTAQHRPSRGVTVQANYTWSHCINTGTHQNIFSSDDAGDIPERIAANRGNCAGLEVDRRHNFNLSTVFALPRFSSRSLRMLATGWQLSGIVKLLSGSYLTVTSGLDNALSATTNQRPNQVLASAYAPDKNIDQWLNPAAFAQPALGTYGNLGARNIRGPGSIGIDLGLTRRFSFAERQSIEFRAEAFNLPNHLNPGNPVTTLTSSTFGKIQSAGDPRILQFALKYAF